jgi:uncharacterized protein (TIGR02300 family)
VAKAELGVKRRCLNCNAPFFDLNRVPIVCPKCDAVFQVVEIAYSPARRVPIRPVAIERPAPGDPVIADLVLPVGEEAGEESTIPPVEEDDEMEEVEEIIEIERDDKAPDS